MQQPREIEADGKNDIQDSLKGFAASQHCKGRQEEGEQVTHWETSLV
jgi:hypothetical protein